MQTLHVFTIADSGRWSGSVPEWPFVIRTHHALRGWSLETTDIDNMRAMAKIIAGANRLRQQERTPLPMELPLSVPGWDANLMVRQAVRACWELERGRYSARDGGPYAMATQDEIYQLIGLQKFLEPLCGLNDGPVWRQARDLASILAQLNRHFE